MNDLLAVIVAACSALVLGAASVAEQRAPGVSGAADHS